MTLKVSAVGDGNKTQFRLARTYPAHVGIWMLREHYANPIGLQLEANPKTGEWTLTAFDESEQRPRVLMTGTMTHRGIKIDAPEADKSSTSAGVGLSEGDL